MKLYYTPGACSFAIHIALREAALPFELVKVDLKKGVVQGGGDYHRINPRGYVPLLELKDGRRLTEGVALLQYVAELAPAAGLLPSVGDDERFQVLQWLVFCATELYGPLGWLWKRDTPEQTVRACRDRLATRFAELDNLLGTRPHIAGHNFSIADAYFFTLLSWAPHVGISLGPFPHLDAYLSRIAVRPAVLAALAAEDRIKAD